MLFHREITIFLLFLLRPTIQQYIFDKTCEYTAVAPGKTEHLKFASQIFHLSGQKFDVYINVCEKLQNVHSSCDGKSHVCVVYKRGARRRVLPRFVTTFNGIIKFDNDNKTQELFLQTNPLGKCQEQGGDDADKDYEFKVIIDKNAIAHRITSAFECSMEITIPHPSVAVRGCAYSHDGLVMDLNQLQGYPEQEIVTNHLTTILAACHPAASCSPPATICEVNKGKKHTVAETQHIVYEEGRNLITVRGKKDKVKSVIELQCNWTVDFGNPQALLAKHKYSVDTRLGCVKMPFNCEISDVTNYVYNLSSLNKPSGWIVKDATAPMKINVCGTLDNHRKPACEKIYSQVCSEDDVSYGALHTGLNHNGVDIVLDYTHGSVCPNDSSKFLSSRVVFQCHREEVGPVLTSIANCIANISWRTPTACAIGLTPDSNFGYANVMHSLKKNGELSCSVSQDGQVFRLGSLKTLGARFPSKIWQNLTYVVNICRAIPIDAENYFCDVTGACVEDRSEVDVRKRFVRIGNLVGPKFENDEIVIHYSGGVCDNVHHRELVITFNCSRNQEPLKLVNETLCRADFILNTPLACKRKVRRTRHCSIASSSGKIIDFENFRDNSFDVKLGNMTYNVDLCSDAILTSKNDTGQVIDSINATKRLIDNQCFYSITYNFPAENDKNLDDCESAQLRYLKAIHVNLLCNEIENNGDHIQNYTLRGCELIVDFKSPYVCTLTNCPSEPIRAVEVPKKTKDVSAIQETQPQITTEKDLVRKTCKVSNDNGFITINSLKPLRFMAKNGDNYTIGENHNGKSCGGFVCKNNRTLGTLEMCPSTNFVENEGKVELIFIGPKCTNAALYKVKLIYHCTVTNDIRLLKEDECLTEILVQSSERKEFCLLFSPSALIASQGINHNASNSPAYIIGIAICLAIIVVSIVVFWKIKFFSRKLSCFGRTHEDILDSPVNSGLLHLD